MSWNRTSNGSVAGISGMRPCNRNNVAGATGRRKCCPRRVAGDFGIDRIALRGPGCISGTGRCGNFTASFVESNGEFAEGYGNVVCDNVSPGGGRRRRCDCVYDCLFDLLSDELETSTTCPR